MTIDSGRFAREAGQAPAQPLPVAGAPDVQNAAALVRTILLDDGPSPSGRYLSRNPAAR